jgi:hypothetical protein
MHQYHCVVVVAPFCFHVLTCEHVGLVTAMHALRPVYLVKEEEDSEGWRVYDDESLIM